jgi:hypothetical protein
VGKQEDGSWASSGDHLEADPATLRGYGQNIAKLRWDFQTDITGAGTSLRGTSKDSSLSTGLYEPGQTCNDLVDSNGQEFVSALNDLLTSMTAIPAAALTMADLFDGVVAHGKAMINAQGDAMAWAFATPGATRPSGVPSYIKGTIQGEMKKAAAGGKGKFDDKLVDEGLYSGAAVQVYSTAGGGKRYVVRTPGGGYAEWGENAKGVRTYQTTYNGNGPVVTKVYSEGEVLSTTKRYRPTTAPLPVVFSEKDVVSVVDEQQKVETYDKDGKLTTTTDHVLVTKYSDNTESHTYSTDKNGKTTTTGTVGRQPAAVTPDTWSELAQKQSQEMVAKAKGL